MQTTDKPNTARQLGSALALSRKQSRPCAHLVLAAALVAGIVAPGCGETSTPLSPANAPSTTPPAATATAAPTPTETPDGLVTIAAVGDVMLARDLVWLMEEYGPLYPFERVAHLLGGADVTVANLEGALTERGAAADKLYTFRTPTRFASGLTEAGIDVASLGNNHTADFGTVGIEDTLAALKQAGVRYAGAGLDEAAARRPVIVEAEGLRIAFLSYTDVLDNTFAGPQTAGVARATAEGIAEGVSAARRQADVVVVSLHSGVEYTDAPQPSQRRLARSAIDAGALVVLGHHSHTLQGWERYRDGLIIYSLGNFVFDLDVDDLEQLGPRAFQTAVVSITLTVDGVVDASAAPVFIDPWENRPRPATAEEAADIKERIQALNEIAGGP